jgi:hypothetical protein
MPPRKFIAVPDLLADVGQGLGRAAQSVHQHSTTKVSALVVKDAQIEVTFEMSSASAESDSALGVGALGAKTLSFGTRTFEETQTNRCTIRINVVNAEPPEADPPPLEMADVGLIPDDAAGIVRVAKKLGAAVQAHGMATALKAQLLKGIEDVARLAKTGQPAQARQALWRFIALHVRS